MTKKQSKIGKYVRVSQYNQHLEDWYFGVVEDIDAFNNAIIKLDRILESHYFIKKEKTWYSFFHTTGKTEFIRQPVELKSKKIVIPLDTSIWWVRETTITEANKLEEEYNSKVKEGWTLFSERFD